MAADTPKQRLEALRSSIAPMNEVNPKLKALIYGVSGVGKTVEAMELARIVNPKGEQILYIDTGEGYVSLMNHPQLMDNVTRMSFEGLSQIDTLVEAIKFNVEGFDNYSTIVFDEFSTVARKDLHTVMDATGLAEFDSPEFKQYNIATRRMEKVAYALLKLKETHHLILIAHAKTEANKITGITETGPSFMQKFGETLKGEMHVVGRMTADIQNKEGAPVYKREVQVHPSKMIVAKSRIGSLDIKVSPERFNQRIVEWIAEGGQEMEEREPVELQDEKPIEGNFTDQTEFVGFEIGE